jgi:hypothetical protein
VFRPVGAPHAKERPPHAAYSLLGIKGVKFIKKGNIHNVAV